MESYRFVAIGIHHYRFFDALEGFESHLPELKGYLQQKLKLSEKQALLFSDLRSFGKGRIIYPNGNNLRKALQRNAQVIFFQGYATHLNDEDYLLPIDAHPDNLQQTAITLRSLLDSFSPFDPSLPPLLLLDVTPLNLENPLSHQGLLEAQSLGINLVVRFNRPLSGRGELGQFFLEAMGYYNHSLTLDLLEMYLRDKIEDSDSSETLIILSRSQKEREAPILPPSRGLPFSLHLRRRNPPNLRGEDSLAWIPTPPILGKSLTGIGVWLSRFALLLLLLGGIGIAIRWLVGIDRAKPKTLERPLVPSVISSQAQLMRAKSYLQWQQASVFIRAIAELRKIPPESPLFPQAQNQISLWSQIILEIAEGREGVGNLKDAIAAAELVPKDRPQLYRQAQEKIQDWKKEHDKSSSQAPP